MGEDTRKAVGLTYDSSAPSSKPQVSARGEGTIADTIISRAQELGIYVHKDPTLLKNLEHLKEGDTIPKPLFTIIAEILAYSYYLQGKTPERWRDAEGRVHVNTKS